MADVGVTLNQEIAEKTAVLNKKESALAAPWSKPPAKTQPVQQMNYKYLFFCLHLLRMCFGWREARCWGGGIPNMYGMIMCMYMIMYLHLGIYVHILI